MRNDQASWALALCLLALVWGGGCLNPRPEDFPSAEPPGDMTLPGEGNGDGMSQEPEPEPEPNVPSTGEPPREGPGSTPGGMIGAADAGVPPSDAAPPDADAGTDAN